MFFLLPTGVEVRLCFFFASIDVLVRVSVTCHVFAALRRCEYAFDNLRHKITNVLCR